MSDNSRRSGTCRVILTQDNVKTHYAISSAPNGWTWKKIAFERCVKGEQPDQLAWIDEKFDHVAYNVFCSGDGELSCNCPGYQNHKHCKHSDYIKHFTRAMPSLASIEESLNNLTTRHVAEVDQLKARNKELQAELRKALAQLEESEALRWAARQPIEQALSQPEPEPKPAEKKTRTRKAKATS